MAHRSWALEWAGLGFEPIHLYGRVTFGLSAPVPCMVREHEPNAWGLGLMVSGDHKNMLIWKGGEQLTTCT